MYQCAVCEQKTDDILVLKWTEPKEGFIYSRVPVCESRRCRLLVNIANDARWYFADRKYYRKAPEFSNVNICWDGNPLNKYKSEETNAVHTN